MLIKKLFVISGTAVLFLVIRELSTIMVGVGG